MEGCQARLVFGILLVKLLKQVVSVFFFGMSLVQ